MKIKSVPCSNYVILGKGPLNDIELSKNDLDIHTRSIMYVVPV